MTIPPTHNVLWAAAAFGATPLRILNPPGRRPDTGLILDMMKLDSGQQAAVRFRGGDHGFKLELCLLD